MTEYDPTTNIKSALFKIDDKNLRRTAHSAVNEAQAITASLVRMRTTIATDIQRLQITSDVLATDGELIDDSLTEHKITLRSALKRTGRQLRAMARAEFWEKYSVLASMWFFIAVCFFVVLRRTRLLWVAWVAMSGIMTLSDALSQVRMQTAITQAPLPHPTYTTPEPEFLKLPPAAANAGNAWQTNNEL